MNLEEMVLILDLYSTRSNSELMMIMEILHNVMNINLWINIMFDMLIECT